MTGTPAPPPDDAPQLIANGVPPEIANNPDDTSGVALWLLGEYESGRRPWA